MIVATPPCDAIQLQTGSIVVNTSSTGYRVLHVQQAWLLYAPSATGDFDLHARAWTPPRYTHRVQRHVCYALRALRIPSDRLWSQVLLLFLPGVAKIQTSSGYQRRCDVSRPYNKNSNLAGLVRALTLRSRFLSSLSFPTSKAPPYCILRFGSCMPKYGR